MKEAELGDKHLADLHALAAERGLDGYRLMRREKLVEELAAAETGSLGGDGETTERRPRPRRRSRRRGAAAKGAGRDEPSEDPAGEKPVQRVSGALEIVEAGHGFLRLKGPDADPDDVYVSASQIRRCELRDGDEVEGPSRPPRRRERHPALVRVELVNGEPPVEAPLEAEEPERDED